MIPCLLLLPDSRILPDFPDSLTHKYTAIPAPRLCWLLFLSLQVRRRREGRILSAFSLFSLTCSFRDTRKEKDGQD
jgi:hypothetical protein